MQRIIARRLLRLAALAYQSHEVVDRNTRLIAWVENETTHTQGYIVEMEDGSLVVAFRGTEIMQGKDRRTDLQYNAVPHAGSGGMVHEGFYAAWMSVSDMVAEVLEPYYGEGRTIRVTGHSLGAAIAVLAAFRLSELGFNVRDVALFGCPRVGNSRFAAAYNSRLCAVTRRFRVACDAVTKLPPVLWFSLRYWRWLSYRHVGVEEFYDSHSMRLVDPPWLYKIADELQARWFHFGALGTRGFVDHLLSSYAKVLR